MLQTGAGAALDDLGKRLTLALPGAILVGFAAYLAGVLARRGVESATSFVLLLTAMGLYLMMVSELFHIVDSFSGPWRRMNTVFKVYYQAWLLLGIVASFFHIQPVVKLASDNSLLPQRDLEGTDRAMCRCCAACGAADRLALLHLGFSSGTKRSLWRTCSRGETLDGLAYLQATQPGEYARHCVASRDEGSLPAEIIEAVGEMTTVNIGKHISKHRVYLPF